MKTQFKFPAPAFDAQAINETICSALSAAGLDTKAGPMRSVTDIIRRALTPASSPLMQDRLVENQNVIDVVARVIDVQHDDLSVSRTSNLESQVLNGAFSSHQYANRAGTRAYKLYVPGRIAKTPALLVMLHGCTQSADDFAAGTGMNTLADEHGFLVVYPEQSSSANPSKCWNWFKAQDQVRESGEPSLIVGIVDEVAAQYAVDRSRMFVAGLSAGAAMAVILGESYPELFAGVGVHSGLPYRSANDVPSAMLAMKGGRSGIPGLKSKRGVEASPRVGTKQPVPMIVFHGDCDHTVHQSNAHEIVQQAKHALALSEANLALRVSNERGTSSGGRSYTRSVHTDVTGRTCLESWTVHGAGHAWAGGSASGSYTDVSGPNASAEMVRFFLSLS